MGNEIPIKEPGEDTEEARRRRKSDLEEAERAERGILYLGKRHWKVIAVTATLVSVFTASKIDLGVAKEGVQDTKADIASLRQTMESNNREVLFKLEGIRASNEVDSKKVSVTEAEVKNLSRRVDNLEQAKERMEDILTERRLKGPK